MATINNLNHNRTNTNLKLDSKVSSKTSENKTDNQNLLDMQEVETEAIKQDTFSYKSTETFGGYSKDNVLNSMVSNEEVTKDEVKDKEERKGMDISTLVGGNTSSSNSNHFDIDEITTEQLVKYQNMIQKMLQGQAEGEIKIPSRVQMAAKASLKGEGYWSQESVSTRILDMAKSLSGGDAENFEILKEAVIKGFESAENSWGSKLPDITNSTYDLVMKGFDSWHSELFSSVTV